LNVDTSNNSVMFRGELRAAGEFVFIESQEPDGFGDITLAQIQLIYRAMKKRKTCRVRNNYIFIEPDFYWSAIEE